MTGTKNRDETYGLIALAWQGAAVGDSIEITQANDRGGKSLEKTLREHFPDAQCDSRQKARFITLVKTEQTPDIITQWMDHTRLRLVEETGFYSVPGLFGWNKIDMGSEFLVESLTSLKGVGADFGCGYGYLSKNILENNAGVQTLYGLDIDPRAVEACVKNVADPRANCLQADCTQKIPSLPPLDFVVMNPPFHDGVGEDRSMGQKFIETAAKHLRNKGQLWVVANRHMPYESILTDLFGHVKPPLEKNGFKILRALK